MHSTGQNVCFANRCADKIGIKVHSTIAVRKKSVQNENASIYTFYERKIVSKKGASVG